jgi:cyclase
MARVARESFMPLTVGGGIVSADIAQKCMAHGADKVCLTTTATDRPQLIGELASVFGRQAVVLGIDVLATNDGEHKLFDHRRHAPYGDLDWRTWMCEGVALGAGEVRLMSVDREGSRAGLDLALFREARGLVDVPIILEGGAGSTAHVGDAYAAGVEAVAIGTMLVFADNNIIQIKRHLANDKHAMRL